MERARVTEFSHGGITVKDLEKSLVFYCDLLGMELLSKDDYKDEFAFDMVGVHDANLIKVAFLKALNGEAFIELLEYVGGERHPGSSRPSDYGTGHVCFYVNDLTGLYDKLVSNGVSFRSEVINVPSGINKNAKVVYCSDPDGYLVEFVELPGKE
jgi:lactoylglutathione lyase